jgi:endonuclease YncB( thermonuclease family)
MRRAFIENGQWRIAAEEACDAIVQRKATLRVSALASVLTIALFAGPEFSLAIPDAGKPRAPIISQPELVSFKPVDRVPGVEETTASFARRAKATLEAEKAAIVETPRPFAAIEVIDAATLRAGEMTVRIAGIVLPAAEKACRRLDGLAVPCLDRAASYLELLVRGRAVACDRAGSDTEGRELGRCRIGDADVAEQMVRQGWASASEASDQRLVTAEAAARKQKLGIWRE